MRALVGSTKTHTRQDSAGAGEMVNSEWKSQEAIKTSILLSYPMLQLLSDASETRRTDTTVGLNDWIRWMLWCR